jgi:hypothetical protein
MKENPKFIHVKQYDFFISVDGSTCQKTGSHHYVELMTPVGKMCHNIMIYPREIPLGSVVVLRMVNGNPFRFILNFGMVEKGKFFQKEKAVYQKFAETSAIRTISLRNDSIDPVGEVVHFRDHESIEKFVAVSLTETIENEKDN